MAAPVLAWYDATDTTVVTSLSFTGIIPGTPSAAQEKHLWNQKDGVDAETVRNLRVVAFARLPGETVFLAAGTRWLDERWLEGRVVGGSGDVIVALSAWQAVGAGGSLPLADLPRDSAHHIEWRLNPPQVSEDEFPQSPAALQYLLIFVDAPSFAIGLGHSECSPDGVFIGLGDGAYSGVLVGSNVTENDTPDDTIKMGYSGWVSSGTPNGEAAQAVELDDFDGDAEALVSGEAYQALVAWTAAGTAITRGPKAASGSEERPAIPVGHLPRAWVLREFDGVIDDVDIENVWVPARYKLVSTSGLIATFGHGESRVDNALSRHTYPFPVSLAASEVSTVWMTRGGAPDVTVAGEDPPEPRALALYELTTDADEVTAVRDLRHFIGATPRPMALLFPTALAENNASSLDVVVGNRPLLVDPEFPLAFALESLGGTPTADATVGDVEFSEEGGAWTSIFPDAVSMPSIPFDATDPVTRACQPTVCQLPAGARVRSRVEALVTASSAPSGATMLLQGWVR